METATTAEPPESPPKALLALCGLLYLPFAFMGYGASYDTYPALEAGRRLWAGHGYTPSRFPGYFLYEALSAGLAYLGGSVLSNLATILAMLVALYSFWLVLHHFKVPHGDLLTLGLGTNPWIWTSATSTEDQAWAFAALMLGAALLLRGRALTASIAFGLAIGFRIQSAAVCACLFAFMLLDEPARWRRWIPSGAVSLALGLAFYLPPYFAAGGDSLLHFAVGGIPLLMAKARIQLGGPEFWALPLRAGRFAYKNAMLLGLPATLYLASLSPWFGKLGSPKTFGRALGLSAGAVCAVELVFWQSPTKVEILIQALPFFLLAAAVCLAQRKRLLIGLLLLMFLGNFVEIDIARPDHPYHATAATFGLWLKEGPLLEDTELRLRCRRCETSAEFEQAVGAHFHS